MNTSIMQELKKSGKLSNVIEKFLLGYFVYVVIRDIGDLKDILYDKTDSKRGKGRALSRFSDTLRWVLW